MNYKELLRKLGYVVAAWLVDELKDEKPTAETGKVDITINLDEIEEE